MIVAGLIETAIGVMEMALRTHEMHFLVGVGTPFIAMGLMFFYRARRIPGA